MNLIFFSSSIWQKKLGFSFKVQSTLRGLIKSREKLSIGFSYLMLSCYTTWFQLENYYSRIRTRYFHLSWIYFVSQFATNLRWPMDFYNDSSQAYIFVEWKHWRKSYEPFIGILHGIFITIKFHLFGDSLIAWVWSAMKIFLISLKISHHFPFYFYYQLWECFYFLC